MPKNAAKLIVGVLLWVGLTVYSASLCRAEVRAWEGAVTIPTYPWEEDVNPKFWALEGAATLSTTLKGSITYPYTMQDHLSRTKVDRRYKALFLENEYLRVVCLPELGGRPLATLVTPLPIPKLSPPDPSKFAEPPDDQLSVEQTYLKGRKFDRATDRLKAREYYQRALSKDPGHILSLRALAVLDLEAGLYEDAMSRLEKALDRNSDDGLSWYFLGVSHLRTNGQDRALDCGYRAARCLGTASLGYDLVGRALMQLKEN